MFFHRRTELVLREGVMFMFLKKCPSDEEQLPRQILGQELSLSLSLIQTTAELQNFTILSLSQYIIPYAVPLPPEVLNFSLYPTSATRCDVPLRDSFVTGIFSPPGFKT